MPTGEHVHSVAVAADGGLLLGLHGGLYRSDDGARWELLGLSGEDAMVIATAGDGELVFVAGHEVLYRSDDGGDTFSPLTPSDLPGMDIHGFAQSPADPRAVYAFVVGRGLFASRDAGETWEARASIDSIPRDVFGLAVTGSDSDTVVMVGPESGVHRSVDGGRSFERVFEVPSGAVAVDEQAPEVVWVLTAAGLARSDDAGGSWEISSTLDGVEGQPVALAADGEEQWLVTEQPRALYRSDDTAESWQKVGGR
ncbi:MAG: WD40/YVTN/BNR-like repeat-containing protein [Acidimicrobiia bacterium]